MDYQENASIGGGDTVEKGLCSPSQVPLIIDSSQRNLYCVCRMGWMYNAWSFRKISQMEVEMQLKS